MSLADTDRRNFLKKAGGSILAVAAGSSVASSAIRAFAAESAITQTKQTQAAITPHKGLQMLKEGNNRFVQGNMIRRDLLRQVKETAGGQFPFEARVSCIDSR